MTVLSGTALDDLTIRFLARVPLFVGCSPEELVEVAALATRVNASPGESLTCEGESGNELFLVVSGEARCTVAGRPVARFGAADFFGELSMLDSGRRSASVVAETPVCAISFEAHQFSALLKRRPSIAQKLVMLLAERLLAADAAIAASHRAIDEGLVMHRVQPLNAETRVPNLIGGLVPNAHFYVRNHFEMPLLDPVDWRLNVGGQVERPLTLSQRDLRAMRSETLVATLECAGNGRSQFSPPAAGEQWGLGAVSTAEWTGVPLVDVLERTGVKSNAREVLFRGADSGSVDGHADGIPFERSLPLDDAREPDVLLAYAMNGEPLPLRHGHPLRLIVPGWYAVASVKWLERIELLDRPFDGYFQTDRYVYQRDAAVQADSEPVRLQQVRALIIEPAANSLVERGELTVRGVCWSGAAPVARVEVSVDNGRWQTGRLVGERKRHSWQWWELTAVLPRLGAATLRARATDLAGRIQPDEAEWNHLGYANNSIQTTRVTVTL